MRLDRDTRWTPSDRFVAIVDRQLAPALSRLGFDRRRAVLACDRGEVRWLVEIELAPWTNPEKICFTLAWGVDVLGLADVLGDGMPPASRPAHCLVHGRLGEGPTGVEATWFTVGAAKVPGTERLADARTGRHALHLLHAELVPTLRRFESIPAVQAHLVEHLVKGRGVAGDAELRRVRAIAGLSLLLDERENASRWLDYLEARSSFAIAPDVVADRLATLRQRCAS